MNTVTLGEGIAVSINRDDGGRQDRLSTPPVSVDLSHGSIREINFGIAVTPVTPECSGSESGWAR
ncbi:hypothetical protein GQ85_13425 [Rhodococcus rhodochrous]|nr:hypothetical protein GQ85_13425 [Rhodococcus rhodochrous]